MRRRGAIAAAAALVATAALAEGAAQDVHDAMRAAMLEHAPLPSGPATLPDSSAPVLPSVQVAKGSADAERAARARARGDAAAARAEAANRAAMHPTMGGGPRSGGGQYGCDDALPADMMKSRGTMAGGGAMPGHGGSVGGGEGGGSGTPGGGSGGSGGSGTPGGGMLIEPGPTSPAASSGAPLDAPPSSSRRAGAAGQR